ncbi:hypothetical protein BGX20_001849, partial [Mortierella sp. AD010]
MRTSRSSNYILWDVFLAQQIAPPSTPDPSADYSSDSRQTEGSGDAGSETGNSGSDEEDASDVQEGQKYQEGQEKKSGRGPRGNYRICMEQQIEELIFLRYDFSVTKVAKRVGVTKTTVMRRVRTYYDDEKRLHARNEYTLRVRGRKPIPTDVCSVFFIDALDKDGKLTL